MTLADSLQAQKSITLRRYSAYRGKVRSQHQFVGSLMVPKRLEDGRYPVVDVWTWAMEEVVIAPYVEKPVKFPSLFIGAGELNRTIALGAQRLMHIDTVRGVEPTGYGFGFTLYAAAALSAKFAGPDGIFSVVRDRSWDAHELWQRMQKLSFSWMTGPIAKHSTSYWQYEEDADGGGGIDYILGQSVLDSGMVVRVGEKYGRAWTRFRRPPTRDFAFDLKYRAKKQTAWEKYTASHA